LWPARRRTIGPRFRIGVFTASAEETEVLTQRFAWACHGIAPEVLERAARGAFDQRWRRVWGAGAEV